MLDQFVKKYAVSEVLYRSGDEASHLHLLREGAVQLTRVVGGQSRCFATLTAGAIFGEEILLPGSGIQRSATAVVLREAELLSLDKKTFQELAARHQDIATRTFTQLAQRIAMHDELLENLWTENADLRLVRSLCNRLKTRQIQAPGADLSRLPLLPSQLASDSAMSLADLEHALTTLVKRGLIEVDGDHLRVTDGDALVAWRDLLEKEEMVRAAM